VIAGIEIRLRYTDTIDTVRGVVESTGMAVPERAGLLTAAIIVHCLMYPRQLNIDRPVIVPIRSCWRPWTNACSNAFNYWLMSMDQRVALESKRLLSLVEILDG
jgi:hypothetical protein